MVKRLIMKLRAWINGTADVRYASVLIWRRGEISKIHLSPFGFSKRAYLQP